jgi:hypothetical protein
MSATTPPPHRQSHRKLADRILGIQIEPDNYAIVLNVSDGGMGFRAISPITQSGTIRFSFVENGRAVAATGELVWMDEAKMTGGLSFASVPKANRERFRKWIDRGETYPEEPSAPEQTVPPVTVSRSPGVSAASENPSRLRRIRLKEDSRCSKIFQEGRATPGMRREASHVSIRVFLSGS